MSCFLTILILVLGWTAIACGNWVEAASQLSGTHEPVRQAALAQLRATPNLEAQLAAALRSEQRYLAVDVIAALSLKKLLPDLLKLTEGDREGLYFLAVNSLVDETNGDEVAERYQRQLVAGNLSVGVTQIVLDTLGRMGVALDTGRLLGLWAKGSYEIRSALLYFARARLRDFNDSSVAPLVTLGLQQNPFQLKIQSIYLIKDLPVEFREKLKPLLKVCLEDANAEVKKLCHENQ